MCPEEHQSSVSVHGCPKDLKELVCLSSDGGCQWQMCTGCTGEFEKRAGYFSFRLCSETCFFIFSFWHFLALHSPLPVWWVLVCFLHSFFLSRDLSLKQCSKLYYQAVKPHLIHYLLVSSFHSLWGKGQFCKSAVAQGPPMRTTACSMWVWEPGKAARSGLCNGFPAHMLVTVCIDISCKAQN